MIDDRLMKIANHYGLAHQKGKLVEEMAELTKDIMKGDDIVEELVDVEIMLKQVRFLLTGSDREAAGRYTEQREYKIRRQLERMEMEVLVK